MDAEPGIESADATQRQVGIESPGGQAEGIAPQPQPLVLLLGGGDHRAAHHIGMPVQELRGGVHHQVRPVLQRTLQQWREERVVSHHQRPGIVGCR